MKGQHPRTAHRTAGAFERTALALAIGSLIAIGFAGTAAAQETRGTIYGTVPAASGETIQITGGAGFNRSIPVGTSGTYSVTVPVGTYKVSLLQGGKLIQSRHGVSPVAAGSVEVDFASSASNAVNMSAVTVSASRIPEIDVKTTNQVTTITDEQLKQLPLDRSAEAIALLAPGVQPGSAVLVGGPLGTGAVTFGGASTAENAYYVDGMLTTAVLDDQGGIGLPYGSIEQQQTYISGYGAKYGRSIGGVINQIGKSGSNQWHFGVRAQWQPSGWRSDPENTYYANPLVTIPGEQKGDLESYNKDDRSMETVYDAYVSGPIVKDRLFFFLSAEQDVTKYRTINCKYCETQTSGETHSPKLYAKINWNINDNNLLTLTGIQSSYKSWSTDYNYDYDTHKATSFFNKGRTGKNVYRMWTANYTSYITDDLTVHAMFGKSREQYGSFQPAYPGYDPTLPYISGITDENPAFTPDGPVKNTQNALTHVPDNHLVKATDYRLDLDYQLGDHDIQVGIDNDMTRDINDGEQGTGPGYGWAYGRAIGDDIGKPLAGTDPGSIPYVAPVNSNPAGAGGYYVEKLIQSYNPSTRVAERAQYIQDRWQVTPDFLLSLGLRNDQFTNYDAAARPYIKLTKPNWSPRIGFSWDVHGDSTLKVFGNAGRYYLTLPVGVGTTVAAPVRNITQYGTYTGIDPTTGAPIGFEPLPQNPQSGISVENQYGEPRDAKTVAAKNIQAPFSDNYVLGLQQKLHFLDTSWVFGATGTYERLSRMIAGSDDAQSECAAGRAQGYSWMTADTCSQWAQSPVLINPGVDQKVYLKAPDGSLRLVDWTAKDQGYPSRPKRRYYALDLSLTHAWDGKWFAKLDYVYSKLYGNEDGPVGPMYESSGTVAYLTAVWAYPEIMEHSNGILDTDRTHSFKLYGAYAITPEWMVGANLWIASGTPKMCRGAYGPDQVRLRGLSSQYHWCAGKVVTPGSIGRTPWIKNVDLSLDYKPNWADHKLDFKFQVFNVFNEQTPTFYGNYFITTSSPGTSYGEIEARRPPRAARFSVSYDY